MKWPLILLTLFMKPLGRFNPSHLNPAHEMKQFLMDNAKKVLLAVTVTSIISSLFVAGLVITVITMSAQYDQNAGIGLSAMLLGGFGMMGLSLIIGWLVFSPSRESKEMERELESEARSSQSVSSGSPLTDALVLLIHDFVKEREFKRQQVGEYHHVEQGSSLRDRENLRDNLRENLKERRREKRHERREERREARQAARVDSKAETSSEPTPEESYFGYKDDQIRH